MRDRFLGLYAMVSTAAAVMLFEVCVALSPSDGAVFWIVIALSTVCVINALIAWTTLLLRARDRRQFARKDVGAPSTR